MSTVSDRLKSLEDLLSERENNLSKKITRTIIIYTILVAFTAGYTLFMVHYVKKQTSPDIMSEIAVNLASQYASKGREHAVKEIAENSEVLAQTVVKHTIDAIPKAEAPLVNVADIFIDYIDQHMKTELIPAFTKVLNEHADDLRDRYNDLHDEEKMQGLALILIDVLEIEMDKYIGSTLISEVFELKKKLLALAKPKAQLTKQQYAQRQVLINWIYLTENQEVGDSYFFNFLEKIQDDFNSIMEHEELEDDLEGVGISTAERL